MKVRELIDILEAYPPELDVELVIVCPVDSPGDPVEVDRYGVGAVLTWEDEEDEGELAWLVGGEEDDLEAFVGATGLDEHDHDGHGHGHDHGHDHGRRAPRRRQLIGGRARRPQAGRRRARHHASWRPGMVVGLGTGSTAVWAVRKVGELLAAGTLATSWPSRRRARREAEARRLGIPSRRSPTIPSST